MREIKLRAWDCERNKMAKVTWFGFNDGELTLEDEECSTWQAVYGYTAKVMQYTGLKDNKDKEVYEGDIVKYENGCIAQIVWDNEEYHAFLCLFKCSYLLLYGHDNFEVIGNIYENPELLEAINND